MIDQEKEMKIELHKIPVRKVFEGYQNSDEEGVVGFGGKLNIRPKYQREFVYKDKQRDAVIDTVRKNFPLNIMYWAASEDGYELLDGQQRTLSLCEYIKGNFSIDYKYFFNLEREEQEEILDYELMVYFCEGTDREKLDWFRIVNIAGEKLTEQELRNAVYAGPWLSDAKKYFSKTNCPARVLGEDFMSGSPIRQEYLERALGWISDGKIEDYMSRHQFSPNANELWLYFNTVINWAKVLFPKVRKEMKDVPWGTLYNYFHGNSYDAAMLEARVSELMADDDVTKKSGIYAYLFDGEEKHLSIRAFAPGMKRGAYERQNGICAHCGKRFDIAEMEADHITPWHLGGKTTAENCQMLCRACNRAKSGK